MEAIVLDIVLGDLDNQRKTSIRMRKKDIKGFFLVVVLKVNIMEINYLNSLQYV